MNQWATQESTFAACEEMRGALAAVDRRHPVFCPKPRRLGPLSAVDPARTLRWQVSHLPDPCDSRAMGELLDLFSPKGEVAAASPPFFCGSPPSRAANPLVHDALFGDGQPPVPVDTVLPAAIPSVTPPPLQMSPRTGCVRAKFGFQPAAIRIEGFECLDRDRRRSRSITAVA